ncbi:hypothetical protein [Thiocystis violacea]|uniref:hypothetical protein n=1 Tax=Thiocystis violacea TaxID=13725 RepID=UPI001906A57D|nr:hypothetical protein [Thiocystis violacea]
MNDFYELIGSTCRAAESEGNTLSTEEINDLIGTVMTDRHMYDTTQGLSSGIRGAITYFRNRGDHVTVAAIHSVTGY